MIWRRSFASGRLVASAARRLNVTKSVVSKRIRDLEVALAVQLFHRTPGQLQPTEAGEAFHERIAPLLNVIHETAEGMASHGEAVALRGRLRVATPMSFGILYLGPVIAAFARQHPDLEIAVDCDDRPMTLSHGGYDVAIRIGYLQDASLKMRTLGECPRVLRCSPDYAQRRGVPRQAAELAEHDAIDYALVHASRFWRLNTSHVPAKVRTFIAYLVGIFSPSTPWERVTAGRAKQKTREADAVAGFRTSNCRCRRTEYWWSRRESNPRPQILHREFYILSSVI